jgi:hypothetical protein
LEVLELLEERRWRRGLAGVPEVTEAYADQAEALVGSQVHTLAQP